MQKLDFVKNLEIIIDDLKSKEILFHFESGFSNPHQEYKYNDIVPLLFSSKSNYERIKNEDGISKILEIYNCENLYSSENLTYLTRSLPHSKASAVFGHALNIELFNFHNTLVKTHKLSKELLLNDLLNETYEESLEEGLNIFQIVIDEESLETSKYIKILTCLTELIDTINKIKKEEVSKSEIILLDSGSDTNVGIKTGIETAKSLFLIFKEVWDFATNHKQYKNEQNNKALLESLSIRAEILKKVEDGVISDSEGIEYVHLIKTRTDDLIGMKVMPKLIVIENNKIENKKLLKEMQGTRLLSSGE